MLQSPRGCRVGHDLATEQQILYTVRLEWLALLFCRVSTMDAALGWPSPAYFTLPEASAGFSLRDHPFLPEPSYPVFPGHGIVSRPWLSHFSSIQWASMFCPWIFFFLTFNFFFSLSSFIPLSFHVLFAADNQTSGVFPVLNHRPGFQLLTRGFGCSASLLAHQGLLASLYLILVSTVFSWTQGQAPFLLSFSVLKKNNISFLLLFNIKQ